MQTDSPTALKRDIFLTLGVAYFALPNLIFLLGWVRPIIGIPTALIVAWSVASFGWQKKMLARSTFTLTSILLILSVAFLWTLLAGVGGVLPQGSDYVKHNLLWHDLTGSSWPVKYPHADGGTYLCYALGYYLVPALGGCWLGADAVPAISFIWTAAGLVLFFWWVATLTNSPWKTMAAILLFAPTCIFWTLLKSHGIPGIITGAELEPKLLYGGLLFNGFDSFTRFNYAPQHALTGWLGAALLYERLWVQKNPRGVVLLWAACVFWSPLSSLGLLLVPLAAWPRVRWQKYLEPVNLIAGGVLLGILGVYFQGHLPLPDKGFIGAFLPGTEWIFYYSLFVWLQFTPLLLLWLVERKVKILDEWRPLFFGSSVVLLLLPLYKFGIYGDLRVQASAPAMLFLALAADRMIQSEKISLKNPLCLLLTSGLLAGAIFPVVHPLKNLLSDSVDYSYTNISQSIGWHNVSEITDTGKYHYDLASQYQGRDDSFAVRWMLRENSDPKP